MVARISSAPFTMHGVVPHSWMNHLPTFSLHEHGKSYQIQHERGMAGRRGLLPVKHRVEGRHLVHPHGHNADHVGHLVHGSHGQPATILRQHRTEETMHILAQMTLCLSTTPIASCPRESATLSYLALSKVEQGDDASCLVVLGVAAQDELGLRRGGST